MPPAAYGAVMAGMAIYQGMKKNPAEQATTNLSNTMSGFAKGQHSMAQPALAKAMQYYTTLAGGNRQAITSALAPSIQGLNSSYKGAETRMSMMPAGPTRDRQMAELQRQKAGQLGMMPLQERGRAFETLLGQGNTMNQQALGAWGQQALLIPQMRANSEQSSNNWMGMGQAAFNIFQPYLTGKQPWGDSLKMGGGTGG